MKRYLLFGGNEFYAFGGWNDFIKSIENRDEAIQVASEFKLDWIHIYDTIEEKIIYEKGSPRC